ncbi:hypothetical protein L204_102601 [Cryptococcus depauperatus]
MKHNDEGAYTDSEIVDTLTTDGLALGRIKYYDRNTKGSIVGAKHLLMLTVIDKVSIGFYSGTPGIIRNPNTLLSEFTDTDASTCSLAKDFGAKGNSCSIPVVCEKLGFVCDLTDGVMETSLLLLCFSIASCLNRYEQFIVPPLDFLPMPKMNARKIVARILVAATNTNRLSLKSDFYTVATLAYGSVLLCN